MTQRRKTLLIALAGFILLTFALVSSLHQSSGEMAARQKLDNLLGQVGEEESLPGLGQEQEAPSEESDQPGPEAMPRIQGGSFFGMPMPLSGAGVDVQELADKYVLHVPLADPQDASSVKLNVSPHRIEVSGQTGSKENGAMVTSSFMQSFTTSQEVLPDQVTRKTQQKGEDTELVITIPKRQGQQTDENSATESPQAPGESTGQDVEAGEDAPAQPEPDNNPWNGIENKVI